MGDSGLDPIKQKNRKLIYYDTCLAYTFIQWPINEVTSALMYAHHKIKLIFVTN